MCRNICSIYDMYITNTCTDLNQPIITHHFSRTRCKRHGHITFIPSATQLKVGIHHFKMKFFRIRKASLAIFFVLQVLDDFAAGQQYIMVSTDGPEQFPIIHARKSICVYFYKFVLNSTASLLNLSSETFTEDLQ